MRKWLTLTLCALALSLPAGAFGDTDLVKTAQKDLVALGYDPGNIQGEVTTQTTVAVSKFQAEQGMEVTGEVTPQLVGALKAAIKQQNQPAAPAAAPAGAAMQMPQQQQLTLQQRQQACLQEKYMAAQERNKKKRGMMRLLGAVTRGAARFGGHEMARVASDVYGATATAQDLSAAAKDLGLTEDEVEECRNPP